LEQVVIELLDVALSDMGVEDRNENQAGSDKRNTDTQHGTEQQAQTD
jgi:hypothetical protein